MTETAAPVVKTFVPPTYLGMTVWYFKGTPEAKPAIVKHIHQLGMCHLLVMPKDGNAYPAELIRHYSDPWFKDDNRKRDQFGYWTTIPVDVVLRSNPLLLAEIARAMKDLETYLLDDTASKIRGYMKDGSTDAQIASYLKKQRPLVTMQMIQQIRGEYQGIPDKALHDAQQVPAATV